MVGSENATVTAGLLFARAGDALRINWLAVAEGSRRRHVRAMLVGAAVEKAGDLTEMRVDTLGSDVAGGRASRRLYQNCGFVAGPVLPNGPEGGSRQRFTLRRATTDGVEMDVTRDAMVIRSGLAGGAPLGTSGRARLKVLNQPADREGYAIVEGSHPIGEPRIRDHIHAEHEETFAVLEGRYRVRLGDEIVSAEAGDYVFVPRGIPHTYRNDGPGPAKVLNIISPADGVELLAELGKYAGTPMDEELLIALHARHRAVLVEPLTAW